MAGQYSENRSRKCGSETRPKAKPADLGIQEELLDVDDGQQFQGQAFRIEAKFRSKGGLTES